MPAPAEKGQRDDELNVRPQDDEARDESGKDDSGKSQKTEKKNHEQPRVDQAKIDQVRAQMYETFGLPDPEAQTLAADKKRFQLINTDPFKTLSEGRVESLKTEDGKYFVSGVTSLDKEHLQNIFEEQGIKLQIEFPKDWNKRSSPEKRSWLRKQGIEVIPAIAGESGEDDTSDWLEKLPDSSEVSSDLANYIREIEKIGKGERAPQDKYSALQNIDENLTSALVKGGITADEASINQVQEAISEGLSATGRQTLRDSRMYDDSERRHLANNEGKSAKEAAENVLNLAKDNRTSGADWDSAVAAFKGKVEEVKNLAEAQTPADYMKANDIVNGLELAKAGNKDIFQKLPAEIINEFDLAKNKLADLDNKFQRIYNQLSEKEKHDLVGDINIEATIHLKSISAGYSQGLSSAKNRLLTLIGEDDTGIREWRVVKSVNSLDEAVRVNQLTDVPVIWQEAPEKLASVFSQMESMDFSVEELSVVTNKAINLVQGITPDTPEGRNLRDNLVKELEAFRAFHAMRITMERNDMDPERMLEVFQQYFDDETWEHFEERFSRDSKNREFVRGEGDNVEKVNLFDSAFSDYSERLRQERIKMNMVQELSRRAIANPFSESEIRAVAESMNHQVTDEFKSNLERLRQYFAMKTEEYIADPKNELGGKSIDEIWGRKKTINGQNGIKITHKLVQEWHQKQTMQGAFGYVEKDDIEFLAKGGLDLLDESDRVRQILAENNIDLSTDEGIKKAEALLCERTYLSLRQEEQKNLLATEIKNSGVKLRLSDGIIVNCDPDDLINSGFLDSVNSNAYYITWMFQWSNYDSIRVYSRDTNSGLDDDFESIVFHQNTNMFWGRHVDHIWEFYHDTNENRGRPKENDVNRLWKQHLPGKHHYLFPQNSLMVRWTENFMSEDQKKDLERRTQEEMRKWDFDNAKYHEEFYSWMRNAMMMDMIENGEVSMSAEDNKVKFSEIMKQGKVKKFEMIDVFVDRGKHKKYAGPDAFQAYLANPTDDRFVEINDKTKVFYSTRGARQFPWMTLATRAHWDVNSNHRLRLFNVPDLRSAEMENTMNVLEARGDMERKQTEHEKRKLLGFKGVNIGGTMGIPKVAGFEAPGTLGALLGTTPFRRTRQMLEFGRKSAWEAKHVPLVLPFFAIFGFIWGGFTEFLKQSVNQASGRQR